MSPASGRSTRAMHRSARAVTLVELVAVIVILGILSVSSIAALGRTAAASEAAATRQTARDLAYARERAIATGSRCWVEFDDAHDTYRILAEDRDRPGSAGATTLTDPATGRDFVVSLGVEPFPGVGISGVSIEGGGLWIGFDWLGRPQDVAGQPLDRASSISIGSRGLVVVESRTGLVRAE